MTMTATVIGTPETTSSTEFRLAAVDLYRDIHKGIRAELFAITSTAGSIDPADRGDRAALADHIASMRQVLESHAHHEDAVIEPVLVEHAPALSEQVEADHAHLELRFARLAELAASVADVRATDCRRDGHLLYLELASFTSAYLVHQDLEERVIMGELERAIGPDGCAALHGAIVGSIPPPEMARCLAFMLPAMNADDRADMLGGIRMAAPPEAFAGVVDLARSVLSPRDANALVLRLGLDA